MDGVETLVALSMCVVIVVASNGNNETAIMKHQLKQLEETVSDLQKHMVAQEQKQTAVLSSVLSRLTETTMELDELHHNYTVIQNEFGNYTDRLAKLQNNYTDELARLQHNYTKLENEISSLKGNSSVSNGPGKGAIGQEVAFEASMAKDNHLIKFLENSTLKFPTTQYNKGGCWNSSNGVFTASVNGTYLFWIDLTFTGVMSFTLSMKRNEHDFGKAFGRLPYPRETSMISRISLTELIEGDRVHFVANKNVNYLPLVSSCGGVLLHYDTQ